MKKRFTEYNSVIIILTSVTHAQKRWIWPFHNGSRSPPLPLQKKKIPQNPGQFSTAGNCDRLPTFCVVCVGNFSDRLRVLALCLKCIGCVLERSWTVVSSNQSKVCHQYFSKRIYLLLILSLDQTCKIKPDWVGKKYVLC